MEGEDDVDAWRTRRVLKTGETETTELVDLVLADGSELGPYVRKRFVPGSGLGEAYAELLRAQREGIRFAHLPRIVEVGRRMDAPWVVMEHIAGETLEALVYREGASIRLASRVMPGLCDAVRELHERFDPPLIHRDLKPGNVIVGLGVPAGAERSGRPLATPFDVTLIDLGIARSYREGADTDTRCFGTRAYAPPEQFGFGQTDVRSDVYALGMVAVFCCLGMLPTPGFLAGDLVELKLPMPLAHVLSRACALDPARRFASVQTFCTALVETMQGQDGAMERPRPLSSAGAYSVPCASVEFDGSQMLEAASADDAVFPNPWRVDAGPQAAGKDFRSEAPSGAGGAVSWDAASVESGDAPRDGEAAYGEIVRSNSERAERTGSLAARVPESVGFVWNSILLLAAIFFDIASIAMVVSPNAELAVYPRWALAIMSFCIVAYPSNSLFFMIADKRGLSRYVKLPKRWLGMSAGKRWMYAIASWALVFFVFVVVIALTEVL